MNLSAVIYVCTAFSLFVIFPGVFLSSRVTGTCHVTTDLIMRYNVRTTTTTATTVEVHPFLSEASIFRACIPFVNPKTYFDKNHKAQPDEQSHGLAIKTKTAKK